MQSPVQTLPSGRKWLPHTWYPWGHWKAEGGTARRVLTLQIRTLKGTNAARLAEILKDHGGNMVCSLQGMIPLRLHRRGLLLHFPELPTVPLPTTQTTRQLFFSCCVRQATDSLCISCSPAAQDSEAVCLSVKCCTGKPSISKAFGLHSSFLQLCPFSPRRLVCMYGGV